MGIKTATTIKILADAALDEKPIEKAIFVQSKDCSGSPVFNEFCCPQTWTIGEIRLEKVA